MAILISFRIVAYSRIWLSSQPVMTSRGLFEILARNAELMKRALDRERDRAPEQLLLAAEVVVDERRVEPRRLRDVLRRHGREITRGEELERRLADCHLGIDRIGACLGPPDAVRLGTPRLASRLCWRPCRRTAHARPPSSLLARHVLPLRITGPKPATDAVDRQRRAIRALPRTSSLWCAILYENAAETIEFPLPS